MQTKNISRNALLKRLNRRLQHAGERVHTSRGQSSVSEFGAHYATDALGNISARHVEPKEWARELGLLRSDETFAA